jgi:hypothetical protein
MYNLDFGPKLNNMALPSPNPLALIRYSCLFWADYLCSLDGKNLRCLGELTDDGKVSKFVREYLLYWLEAMSLLGKLLNGVVSIRKLLLTT